MADRRLPLPKPPADPCGTATILKRETLAYCRQYFEARGGEPFERDTDGPHLNYAEKSAWWRRASRIEDRARRIRSRLHDACADTLGLLRNYQSGQGGPAAEDLLLVRPRVRRILRELDAEEGLDRAPFPGEPTLGAWIRFSEIESVYAHAFDVERLTTRDLSVLVTLAGYWRPSVERASGKSVGMYLSEVDAIVRQERDIKTRRKHAKKS